MPLHMGRGTLQESGVGHAWVHFVAFGRIPVVPHKAVAEVSKKGNL